MWIFLNNAFLSIVEPSPNDNVDATFLKVRARFRGDIERVFPDAAVRCTPNADYRYRALVRRGLVAETIATSLMHINYENFKDSVTEHDRHNAYAGVWTTMWRAQEQTKRKVHKRTTKRLAAIHLDDDAML